MAGMVLTSSADEHLLEPATKFKAYKEERKEELAYLKKNREAGAPYSQAKLAKKYAFKNGDKKSAVTPGLAGA